MSAILILAEHKKGQLKKATLEVLSTAQGKEVDAIIFGSDAGGAPEDLAAHGCKKVFWVNSANYENYHPEAYAAAVETLVNKEGYKFFLGSSSSLGKDLIPKIAARFSAPFVPDAVALNFTSDSSVKTRRPLFSGKALADVDLSAEGEKLVCVSLRPNSVSVAPAGLKGEVVPFPQNFDFASSPLKFVKRTQASSDRPDLTEASIIISGGRSMKTKENFKILFDAADAIGAAVGASRAAVDEGLASHDMQVGQTGKTVNPSLYIACGISGAIQHLAGMRTSKVIVAINKDSAAPIFTKANYGIVADLFEVVPAMTEEFKKLKAKA